MDNQKRHLEGEAEKNFQVKKMGPLQTGIVYVGAGGSERTS